MKNLNQVRAKNLPLETISLDAKNTQLTLANISFLYRNLTSNQQNTLLALRTNNNVNGWQFNSLGASQEQFLLSDNTSGGNTGLSVRTGATPKVGIGNTTSTCALQVTGGVAITSNATDAVDPGIGNLNVANSVMAGGAGNFTGSLSVAGGMFNLVNGTNNLISFANTVGGLPSITTRSAGTKLLLRQALSATTVDYGIGVDSSGTQWYSIPSATNTHTHAFYGATTELMRLQGDGKNGLGTSTPGCRLQVNGGVAITGASTAATDPGAGNLSVANQVSATLISTLQIFATGESRLNGGITLSIKILDLTGTTTQPLFTVDCVIIAVVSPSGSTIQLPSLTSGKMYRIKKRDNDSNALTIRPVDSTKTIDGQASITISTGRASVDVISDINFNWWIL